MSVPPGDTNGNSFLYGIIASLVSLCGWLMHKAFRSPQRKPTYENGRRLSQQEVIQSLQEAIAHQSAKIDAFGNRLLQLELDRDEWHRENTRRLDRMADEISRIRRLASPTSDG